MATSRFFGAMSFTILSPIRIVPSVISSSPATGASVASLCPPHLGGRLAEEQPPEQLDGFREALLEGEEDVFVLDREHVVVAHRPESAHDVAPEPLALAVADRAERPGPVYDLAVVLRVEHAVPAHVRPVEIRVF